MKPKTLETKIQKLFVKIALNIWLLDIYFSNFKGF